MPQAWQLVHLIVELLQHRLLVEACTTTASLAFLPVSSTFEFFHRNFGLGPKAGFIFEHLARNPRFDNVTRRPGYSRGPSGFLPVSIEGMSFFIGLFSKEKGTFGFLGALSPSKSPKSQKDLFSRKQTVKMTFPPTLEKSASSREYPGSSVTLSRRGAKS